jgi:hypothetical protein
MLKRTDPVQIEPDDVEEAMPLPSDPTVIYLAGLFFLALTAALYVPQRSSGLSYSPSCSLFCSNRCNEYWLAFTFPNSFPRS